MPIDPTRSVRLIPHQTFYDNGNAYPGAGTLYRPGELPSSLYQYCRNDGDDVSPVANLPQVSQVITLPSAGAGSNITTLPINPDKIDLNTADSEAISNIEGMTTTIVNTIVREREKSPFVSIDDALDRVPKLKPLAQTLPNWCTVAPIVGQ